MLVIGFILFLEKILVTLSLSVTRINMELYYDLQIAAAWKPFVKKLGLWKSVRSLGRLYDAGMGMLIFIPVAFVSWFPFVSTFQTRLMFNQAFSRGLEISLILAGNNPNN
jgi:callose synthase